MQILSIRPATRPRDSAVFDVQVGDGLRLYNLALRSVGGGRWRVVAPNAYGKHAATFAPELAKEITAAALSAMGGHKAYADSYTTR